MDYNKRNTYSIYKTLIYRYPLILALLRGLKQKLYYTIGTDEGDGCRWIN